LIFKNIRWIIISIFLVVLFVNLAYALPIGSCTPDPCPEGYRQEAINCSGGTCSVNCTSYSGCSGSYTTVYSGSEFLPNLNISSYSGAYQKYFTIASYTPNDTSKCYKSYYAGPYNFVSASDIDGYSLLSNHDSGIALFWDDEDGSRWYEDQEYYTNGENSEYIWSTDGAVWIDSCTDDGDDFDSADLFNRETRALYCAPTQAACNDFNSSYCNTGCYNEQTDLTLALWADLEDGVNCNSFSDFENVVGGIGNPQIDYVTFDSQSIAYFVWEYDAEVNDSFISTCEYSPECNPADPCCDQNGNFKSSGEVCKSAHNAVCDSVDSSVADGHAYEDRCGSSNSECPDNNYEIDYDKVCDEAVCLNQSCSGNTFQPQRTIENGICQVNDPYDCPKNLNCLDAFSCKKSASSDADCRTGYVYDNEIGVCWPGNLNSSDLFYDANGNLVNYAEFDYEYNQFNQLINVKYNITGELITEYFYDSNGERVKKVEYSSNTTTYYLGSFISIVNSSGTYNESYYYYYDKLVGRKDFNGNIYFYHPDYLGSTSLVTDISGNVVADLSYEPFGELSESSDERYTYTGHESDSETDNLYMKARYYDSEIGKFMQPDNIIGDIYNPQDLNKYAYVRNNPYKYTDPNGEWLETGLDIGFLIWDIKEIFNDPYDWTNHAAFIADGVGTALPFVTGLGAGVKALTKGAKAIKGASRVAKTADKINDVRRISSKGSKSVRGAGKAVDKSRDFGKVTKEISRSKFRKNLIKATGDSGIGKEAHHIIPKSSVQRPRFNDRGITNEFINSVDNAAWAPKGHGKTWNQYERKILRYMKKNPTASADQITDYARSLTKDMYGGM
jgi:RHS repeat-associated protein